MKIQILLLVLLFPAIVYSQYNPQISQRINTLEYINPSFNASKEVISFNFMSRIQLPDESLHSNMSYFNYYIPINHLNTGFGMNLVSESIGMFSKINFDLTACVDLKIGNNSNLGFGLMGGIESNESEVSEGEITSDYLGTSKNLNSNNIHVGFGLNLLSQDLNLGASLHYNQFEEIVTNGNYTLFFNGSYVFYLDADLDIKTSVLYQNWGKLNVVDYGVLFIYEKFISFGIYNRWDQALIFYSHIKLYPFMNFAYSYDLGINKETKSNFGFSELKVELALTKKKRRPEKTLFGDIKAIRIN